MAQERHGIQFELLVGNNKMELEKPYAIGEIEGIKWETVRFYISNIEYWKAGNKIGEPNKKHHLLDAENPSSLLITTEKEIEFDQIKFDIGIDSITNVSGAMGGDLDPTKGMYWAWQTGYINIKLEGTAPNCPARKNRFQFHLGGYLPPYYALQSVQLKFLTPRKTANIGLKLDEILNQIDLTQHYEIMRPCEAAVRLSEIIAKQFVTLP